MAYKYCQHVRENGTFCGSGAVKGRAYCYFHLRVRARRLAMAQAQSQEKPWRPELPPLEDMHSVQVALMQVADGLAQDAIEPRRAGLLLYALQQAASNLQATTAWLMGSPFQLSSEKENAVVKYPGLESEFGLPPRIDLDAPPRELFPSPPTSIANMSDEEWRGVSERAIQAAIAYAPADFKKPPESAHSQTILQATGVNR
jgi:hypothetical protein